MGDRFKAVNRPITHGDRVEVGDIKRSDVDARSGGNAYLRAVEDVAVGRDEYVVVTNDLDDGEDLTIHSEAVVLGITRSGQNTASLWVLLPTEVFANAD